MSSFILFMNFISPGANAQEMNASNLIEQFLDSETFVVAYSEIQSLDLTKLETTLSRPLRVLGEIELQVAKLRKGNIANVAIAFGATGLLGNPNQIAGVLICNDAAIATTTIRSMPGFENAVTEQDHAAVLFGATKKALEWLKITNGNPLPALVSSKKEWKGNQNVAVALPEDFVSNLASTLTTTSDAIDLLKDLKWISAYGDLAAGKQTMIAEYGSSDTAKRVMDRLRKLPSFTEEKTVELEQIKSQLTVRYSLDSRFLEEIFGAAVENSSVLSTQNQMKQIALAMHLFYDAYNCIPPQAIVDKRGKPLLSWRVLLLPYLDQKELYAQFHLDEPWDSPHNLTLVKQMPKEYAAPDFRNAMDGRTRYLAPLAKNSTMGTPGAPLTFGKITDGASNTIWMVEASEKQALVWTKPEDIVIDAKDPLRGIVSPGSDRIQTSRLDGWVGEISSKIKSETANALFSINGGEVIEEKDLKPE